MSSSRDAVPGDSRETEWVARAAEGDEGAFRALVEIYQDAVFGVALRMLRNREYAADAAQDAFIKAWRGIAKFESRSRFGTWIYRITVNVCYDRLARRPEMSSVPLEDLVEQGREPEAPQASEGSGTLEEKAATLAFEVALAELPDTYRLPFVLRQVEDKAYGEIAEILGITETNAKVRVHRAREALVEKLRKKGIL